ncbi:WD-40 repeat-containing protein [Calothrix sp. NIES-2100]|uniref:WD40 repeat domain-containing protein n=1 Tax=Calothrix sp. NIES-2100 TaxID=1954172 RepID=UPI000B5FA0D3|nr:WD-40 repeat-containing protein [Calothrix sp. NIES-2100]
MAEISGEIIQELSRVLQPFMWDKQQRQAYLIIALGTNANVLNRLVWDTPVDVFIPHMVKELVAFGEITPGKPALCSLLEVIGENVGLDSLPKIENLLRQIREELRNKQNQVPKIYINSKLIQKILTLLRPLMENESQRRAYLFRALGTNTPVQYRLAFNIPTNDFIANLVNELVAYGETSSGKPALCALLEVIREDVGADIQEQIDNLLQEINTSQVENIESEQILTHVFKTGILLDDWHQLETELNNWLAQVASSIEIKNIQTEYNYTGATIYVNFVEPKIKYNLNLHLRARVFHGLNDAIVYKEIYKFSETQIKTWTSNVTSLLIDLGVFAVVIFQPIQQDFGKSKKRVDSINSLYKNINTLSGHSDSVVSVAISPEGKILASGSRDRTIKLWNLTTGELLTTLTGHSSPVLSVDFSPDGQTLASASDREFQDGNIKLWDVRTGRVRQTLGSSLVALRTSCVAFSPDGQTLATAHFDAAIRLWHISNGKEIRTLRGHGWDVNYVTFSRDGRFLVSGGVDGAIIIWNWRNGQRIGTLNRPADFFSSIVSWLDRSVGSIRSVAISPDGEIIASGGSSVGDNGVFNPPIKLWNASTGNELRILTGHRDSVNAIAFNPDGKILASGGEDNTIRIWNYQTAELIQTLEPQSLVNSLAFSPHGKILVSGTDDFQIRIWELSS